MCGDFMETDYQVVIIGAGPAGTSAGIKLQQFGISSCIIDKAIFPRPKLCGGLITQKTIDIMSKLNIGLFDESIIKYRTNKVNIDACNSPISSFESLTPFTLVDRIDFDDYLLRKYKQLGGKTIEGSYISQIDASSQSVLLSSGKRFSYEVLVGADGATGISSKCVGNSAFPRAFGIEASIPTSQLVQQPQGITLDVGYLPDGYVWIFPKGQNTTIGLACSFRKEIDYIDILKKYIMSKCNANTQYTIKGAFLPYGKHSAKITQEQSKLLLVGDAACLTDCVTGEGIYFAIKSGMIAADTIIENYPNHTARIFDCYEKNCSELINLVNRSHRFMSFFYKNKSLMLKIIKGHSRPLAFICDHQVSQYDYHFEFFKLIRDYFRQR